MDESSDIYPKGPSSVPRDLTRPSRAYRLHAYIAVAGLVAFLGLYFGLAAWFAYTSYNLLGSLGRSDNWIWPILGGSCAGFLSLFMFKSVIFVRRGTHEGFEVLRDDSPRLFAFLERLADEAGAPRPHRVFLSPRVNAAVFYDLSLANLVFRSRKNLEIGLGLINVLTLGEIKAVLAHEFGHFAQRSMAVGRWVYIGQQIAAHMVATRGALDSFLQGLSNIDLRVAWIGWILRLIVWSIRSLVDTIFGWVVMAQRALSREMELQADLVAVSLTGSDSLIHALHRLDAADDAMERAFGFAGSEAGDDRGVRDLFAVQTRMLEKKRAILDDDSHGQVPPLPEDDPASHRLFDSKLAHPPKMWATHPPNEVREANAKRVYVAAPLDDRSGWMLFDDPQRVREEVTASIYNDEDRPEMVPIERSLALVDERFDRRYLDPVYRGVYLGRFVTRNARTPADLYGPDLDREAAGHALAELYPESITTELEASRELGEERAMLEALKLGIADSPGRLVSYRGQEFRRRELPGLLEELEGEVASVQERLIEHDQRVRTAHRCAARALSPDWAAYLEGLAEVLHYAEHRSADLDDAMATLENVYAVVIADSRVTDGELNRLMAEASSLYSVLESIHDQAGSLDIGAVLRERLACDSWSEALGELELPPPSAEQIGDWLGAVSSWVGAAGLKLSELSSSALDELLKAEERVADLFRGGGEVPSAPAAPRVASHYQPLLPGHERPKQTRLGWWDRFQVADGFLPGLARFSVAGAMVGAVVWAGLASGESKIYVVNGFDRPVAVEIGDTRVEIPPHSHNTVSGESGDLRIRAMTPSGEVIEELEREVGGSYEYYVYNIAGATALVEWDPESGDERFLGSTRWSATDATGVLDDANSARARSDSSPVIVSLARLPAVDLLVRLEGEDRERAVKAHARWEPPSSPGASDWFEAAKGLPSFPSIIEARLEHEGSDVMLRRMEQDVGERDAVCADHESLAAERPDSADWQYLAARCIDDPERQRQRFDELSDAHPQHGWLAFAASGDALASDDLGRSIERLEVARGALPALADTINSRLIRLERIVSEGHVDLAGRVDGAPSLGWAAAIESGQVPEVDSPLVAALRALHRGDLEGALGHVAGTQDEPTIVVLAAASDGATEELMERALRLPPEGIGPLNSFYLAAIAERLGRDASPFLEQMERQMPEMAPQVRGFFAHIRDVEAAERSLVGTALELRASLYAGAAVLLGDECPERWRRVGKHALFTGERPFML